MLNHDKYRKKNPSHLVSFNMAGMFSISRRGTFSLIRQSVIQCKTVSVVNDLHLCSQFNTYCGNVIIQEEL